MSLGALRSIRRRLDRGLPIGGDEYDQNVNPVISDLFSPLAGEEALEAINREWRARCTTGEFPKGRLVDQLRHELGRLVDAKLRDVALEHPWAEPEWLRQKLESRFRRRDPGLVQSHHPSVLAALLETSPQDSLSPRFPWRGPNRLRMKLLISEALRYARGEPSRLGWLVLRGISIKETRYDVYGHIDACITEWDGEPPAATPGDWSRKTLGTLANILIEAKAPLLAQHGTVRALCGVDLSDLFGVRADGGVAGRPWATHRTGWLVLVALSALLVGGGAVYVLGTRPATTKGSLPSGEEPIEAATPEYRSSRKSVSLRGAGPKTRPEHGQKQGGEATGGEATGAAPTRTPRRIPDTRRR